MPLEAQIALVPVAYAARQSSRQLHPGNLLRSGKPARSCNHGWGESDSRFPGCCKCCRTGMDPKQEPPVKHIIHLLKDLRQPLKCSFPFSLATNRPLAFSIQMQTSWIQSECSSADWSDILDGDVASADSLPFRDVFSTFSHAQVGFPGTRLSKARE